MADMSKDGWPPAGFVAVGDYAFEPPYIPTKTQVEQAEEFIFTQPRMLELEENQRRRNIIRLAIATTSDRMLGGEENNRQHNFVPLIGGMIVTIITELHEGMPIYTYQLQDSS